MISGAVFACAIGAALTFDFPANALLAVAEMEGGRPGQVRANTDGTHDIGIMQFNTRYLADLARYGIKPADVARDDCYPLYLAAWRLKRHVNEDSGEFWQKVANYHSRTPKHNARYRARLLPLARKWQDEIARRYETRAVGVG